MIKLKYATAQGKKTHDKREDLKAKTMQRENTANIKRHK